MTTAAVTISGLVVDILGAIVIVKSIIFTKGDVLAAQSGTFPGANPFLFEALDNQRLDGILGLSLLVAGFILQLLGTLGVTFSPSNVAIIAALATACSIAYWLYARKMRATRSNRFHSGLDSINARPRDDHAKMWSPKA